MFKRLLSMCLMLVACVVVAFAAEGTFDPTILLSSNITPFLIAGILLQGLIPAIMAALKKAVPDWDKKAWAPPLIGALTMLVTAMTTGKVTDWKSALVYFLVGYAAGGAASSTRDIVVGK